jgi:S1-C subfamily serine protease
MTTPEFTLSAKHSAARGLPALVLHAILLLSLVAASARAQQPVAPDANAVISHAKESTVIILAGEGAGRLKSIATGVVVSKDGVILTALHVIKGAAEVQVRLPNGETFDNVQLIGADERRDVAAIRIPAGGLPFLAAGDPSALKEGDAVYAVTNANGLAWTATSGMLSAMRAADDVPGAGSGFRLLQFNASIAAGSSGGALLNSAGTVVGIITSAKGNAGFAIPIDSVSGLADAGQHIRLGSGSALQLPQKLDAEVPKSSAAIASADPKEILRSAKTVYLNSKTMFLTVDTLDRTLVMQKEWAKLGLTIVADMRVADLVIELDRPLFTYIHTFVITDKRTSIVLGSGKQTAFDGTIASSGLAKDIVKIFAEARLPVPAKK